MKFILKNTCLYKKIAFFFWNFICPCKRPALVRWFMGSVKDSVDARLHSSFYFCKFFNSFLCLFSRNNHLPIPNEGHFISFTLVVSPSSNTLMSNSFTLFISFALMIYETKKAYRYAKSTHNYRLFEVQ